MILPHPPDGASKSTPSGAQVVERLPVRLWATLSPSSQSSQAICKGLLSTSSSLRVQED